MSEVTTQQFLEIDKIKEGVIILKNKQLRGVLMVSSLNFALKEEDEQKAIIYQFQDFLNSLDFSLQMIVQSRKLNITRYFDSLKELEQKQENEMLRNQMIEYRRFIQDFISKGDIMSKNFFVVVPFIPVFQGSPEKESLFKKPTIPKLTEESFKQAKRQLLQRMEFIALGLRRCSLQSVMLGSADLIELFWSLHHPEQAEFGYYPEIPPELIN